MNRGLVTNAARPVPCRPERTPMTPTDDPQPPGTAAEVVLSFDIEEHFRIEAAAGLTIRPGPRAQYGARVALVTRWLLDLLEILDIHATFFIVGQLARDQSPLIQSIHQSGHEVASHGWAHRRVLEMTPDSFRDDVRRSKDALEQITGAPVVGYRAPTFSIVRRTAWALDVLAELGLRYDSSIYPVRHDRYGVPHAPRAPFLARGTAREILELPPATFRVLGTNIPVGGGGYFRLLPLGLLERALRQTHQVCHPPVAMLYFHPWEFDPDQPRLPLRGLRRLRTYVGITRSRDRLGILLSRHRFTRAIDVVRRLDDQRHALPTYRVADDRELEK